MRHAVKLLRRKDGAKRPLCPTCVYLMRETHFCRILNIILAEPREKCPHYTMRRLSRL